MPRFFDKGPLEITILTPPSGSTGRMRVHIEGVGVFRLNSYKIHWSPASTGGSGYLFTINMQSRFVRQIKGTASMISFDDLIRNSAGDIVRQGRVVLYGFV